MPTRLSLLCERIIEASWLGALVATPLLFDVHSDNSFELDKVMVLRSIALLMMVAWIVRGIEVWRAGPAEAYRSVPSIPGRSIGVRWWVTLGLSFLAVHAVSTALSVAPAFSFWGSLTRAQGLYTTGAYLVVYLSILVFLRRPQQMERLISTALIVSFPIALYGIVQHFGTDPFAWSENVTVRIASTLGNPIFVAAFLAMVVPLTIYRHLDSGRRIVETEGKGVRRALVIGGLLSLCLQVAGWRLGPTTGSLVAVTTFGIWILEGRLLATSLLPFARIGIYSVLLSAQLACLLLSQSRGPWIGLAAGVGFFALLHSIALGAWRRVALTIGLGLSAILLLAWMNAPGPFPSIARELPYLDRFSGMLTGTGRVRLLIWEAVNERIQNDPARIVFGYGPETLRFVSAPLVSPALGQIERRGALPDRSHNELLDAVAMTGLAGGAVYLLLFTSLFLWTLPSLGVARSPRERRALLALWLGGGLAGGVLSILVTPSSGLWGPVIPLGMLGGLGVYLIVYAIAAIGSSRSSSAVEWTNSELLMATLLAAVLAHFVETQVGIAVTATRTYFWAYAALLVCARRIDQSRSDREALERGTMDDGDARQWPAAHSFVVALVLGTLTYGLVSGETRVAHLPSIGWLFGLSWIFAGLVCLVDMHSSGRKLRTIVTYSAVTLVTMAIFAGAHAGWLRGLGEEQRMNVPLVFFLFFFIMVAAIGASLARAGIRPARRATLSSVLALPVLLAMGGIAAVLANLDAVRANIAYKQARFALLAIGREDWAIERVQHALSLEPARNAYRVLLGELLTRKGQLAKKPEARNELFHEAEKTLRAAAEMSPLDPDPLWKLARFYATWAVRTNNADRREERFRTSLGYYERTVHRWPGNVLLWNELAALHLSMGNRARAVERYRHSLALDDRFVRTYLQLGDLYERGGEWKQAVEAYQGAVEKDPSFLPGYHALARAYVRRGSLDDAIRAHEQSIAHHPDDPRSHRELARLYFSTGQFALARIHAERALALVPPGERPAMERLLAQVDRAVAASR